ncbi:MAG TPA: acyl-CoA dehydrogenase family protein, partial [Thalassobaculum sp.]
MTDVPPASTAIPAELDTRALARAALPAADTVLDAARRRVSSVLAPGGRPDGAAFDAEQTMAHGFAWLATTVEALRQTLGWADRLAEAGRFGETESALLGVVYGEYLGQIVGGIPMAQTETVRPHDLGLEPEDLAPLAAEPCRRLMRQANGQAARLALAARLHDGMESGDPDGLGDHGLDETLGLVREQFTRFGADRVQPFAHQWHLDDRLIPIDVVQAMADLGTFGLTVPEEYGGLGMGKEALVVVSETLSRAYIGVGSLGTRSEIAAELIRLGGTEAQKAHWLPRIASGAVLPTAVFTEPGTGSDLARLRTRAVRDGDAYRVHGNKTWITHAARTDLMTLLVRTDSGEAGYRGLSMLLAEKPRGTDAEPFPAAGMSGGEIPVLGYRGMKEYEIGFDGF